MGDAGIAVGHVGPPGVGELGQGHEMDALSGAEAPTGASGGQDEIPGDEVHESDVATFGADGAKTGVGRCVGGRIRSAGFGERGGEPLGGGGTTLGGDDREAFHVEDRAPGGVELRADP